MATGRVYRSPLRAEQAAATRQRIIQAARALLLEQGYAATKLDEIARQAGVSLPTLTGYFPNKPGLLQAVLRAVVSGIAEGGEPSIAERLSGLLELPDPHELLAGVAILYRTANQQAFDLFEILRKAATADPKIEQERQAGAEARRRDQIPVAHHLKERRWLRAGLTERQATDILWLYSSADIYRLLVHDSNWPAERYQQWIADTLAHALLDDEETTDR